jgi:adenylate cyclase class 2
MSSQDSREVEVKFPVRDVAALERKLRDAGFHQKTPPTFEQNTLYDNASGDLRRAGEVLRLRIYGDRCLLTHKSRGTSARHKTRIEHETEVTNGGEMHAILEALGFRPAFRYEKQRSEWSDGTGEVVVDRTPIGDLGEIEGEPQWIDRIARQLGVREEDYLTASYVELFFQWKERTGSSARHMTFDECGRPRP